MAVKERPLEFVSLMGYSVYAGTLDDLMASEACNIVTINPHSYVVARRDKEFRDALMSADAIMPDGIGIVIAARLVGVSNLLRVTGYRLFKAALEDASSKGYKCVFVGSSEQTLDAIVRRMSREYPGIEVCTFSPAYRDEFSQKENQEMLDLINNSGADVVFVGMTAPKQEKWVYKNIDKMLIQRVYSIGAVFDFYAGTKRRPPKIVRRLHAEWLMRLLFEPKRMYKRTFISAPIFLYEMIIFVFRSYFRKKVRNSSE